ncbi:MAG: S41 family peptidase [Bacteroidia bacterium]|nr:S41 family peptidase [Bacteroidota bacterium]MBP6512192.1 S41 family peptidase [Bacteroidia bacterium]MBP7243823.1 S41 family peptidase [Bacteroidia bacterium]
MKNWSKIFLLIAVSISMSLQSVGQNAAASQKFDALLNMVSYAYVDSVDQNKVTESAIRALLKDLDPHSVYIPADELKATNEPLVGKFEGVGIQFNILDDTIMVTQTISGGPSEKLGIRSGDRIVMIDDSLVAGTGIKNNDVLKKLRGDKGTKVKVSIARRLTPELIVYNITRDKIPLFSVEASYQAAPGVGYIKISRFADTTVDEFQAALKDLKDQYNIQSLILDLSGNGGGYLNRAIELADEFLSVGKRIVYTEGRNNPKQESYSTNSGGWEKGKLILLVDESSASASEIVSGAIQDWDRGLVIGRRTFAKGLVQKPFPLPDGSAVRLTIARYHTPSGRCIQKAYEPGDENYEMDLSKRFEHGELYHADSIAFNDSLKYETNGGRTVYGGGGIMPDIFVALDTSLSSRYYDDIRRNGIMNDYTLTYVDENRASLKAQYKDVYAFKKDFVMSNEFVNKFVEYAEKKGVKRNEEGLKTSDKLIRTQLKALIARDLWNTSSYYYVINDINVFVEKALESLDNDSFEKMKIAGN